MSAKSKGSYPEHFLDDEEETADIVTASEESAEQDNNFETSLSEDEAL